MTSSIVPQSIESAIVGAIRGLYEEDYDLFEYNSSERALTHKLAEHLQRAVDEWGEKWKVDCEYNRHNYFNKELYGLDFGAVTSADEEAKTVFPDVIVHRRGLDENLLVVEVKKSGGKNSDTDEKKLRAFTAQSGDFRYSYGLLLRIGEHGCQRVCLYEDGTQAKDWTKKVQTLLKKGGLVK